MVDAAQHLGKKSVEGSEFGVPYGVGAVGVRNILRGGKQRTRELSAVVNRINYKLISSIFSPLILKIIQILTHFRLIRPISRD